MNRESLIYCILCTIITLSGAVSVDNSRFTMDSEYQFKKFCETYWFRNQVEQIASNVQVTDQFWRTLFENVRIQEKVTSEISTQMPRQAQQYLSAHVPNMINQGLLDYLPKFLAQNHQMQEILQKHAIVLEDQLETRSRAILKKIVEDPEYHYVNRAYFDAFDRQTNAAIKFAEKRMDSVVNTKMSAFDEQTRKIKTLENENQGLKNNLWWQNVISCISIATSVGAVVYLGTKLQ